MTEGTERIMGKDLDSSFAFEDFSKLEYVEADGRDINSITDRLFLQLKFLCSTQIITKFTHTPNCV